MKEITEGSFKSRVQHCLGNPNSNTMKSKENLINTSRNTKVGIRGEKNNWGWAVCLEDDCGIEREAERQQKEQDGMGNGMVKYGHCLTRTIQGSLTDSHNFLFNHEKIICADVMNKWLWGWGSSHLTLAVVYISNEKVKDPLPWSLLSARL